MLVTTNPGMHSEEDWVLYSLIVDVLSTNDRCDLIEFMASLVQALAESKALTLAQVGALLHMSLVENTDPKF